MVVAIQRELYIKVLEYIQDEQWLAKKSEIFQERDYKIIGNIIIDSLLEDLPEIDFMQLKQIIGLYLNYNKEQYSKITYDDICILVCRDVAKLTTYPIDEYQKVSEKYGDIKTKYSSVMEGLENKIVNIDTLIKINKEHPQLCGTLITNQRKLHAKNNANKSVLKDLKKIEDEYRALLDLIQENYVYREMLNYAKEKIEKYFTNTIITQEEGTVDYSLSTIAIELSQEEDNEIKKIKTWFLNYNSYLESWVNATKSIYKPFYMVKMRKFHDDIEVFYSQGYNGEYWDAIDELVAVCKEKAEGILDSDEWITLQMQNVPKYIQELKRYINDYNVLDYIKENVNTLYCLQERKDILQEIIESFENQKYMIFSNLVVVQIEGLFYDMFIDANIQNRLDGEFDLFEKDDLKSKIEKNDSDMGIEEAALYFKFYFNSLIRNKIAHGRNYFKENELEKVSYELLLDLQYVIHLLKKHSGTNEAIEYIQNTLRWLKASFRGDSIDENIYERLLNSLNENVIRHKLNSIGYVDSREELYWIFNSYYEDAYMFAGVIEQRDELREYLTSEGFWNYVLHYIEGYDNQKIPHIKLKQEFKSRVKAIQAYIAKNKREVLPLISKVSKALDAIQGG